MVNMCVLDTDYIEYQRTDVSIIFFGDPNMLDLGKKLGYFDVYFQITQGNPDLQPGLKAGS